MNTFCRGNVPTLYEEDVKAKGAVAVAVAIAVAVTVLRHFGNTFHAETFLGRNYL